VVVSLVKTRGDKVATEGDRLERASAEQKTAVKAADTKQNSVS